MTTSDHKVSRYASGIMITARTLLSGALAAAVLGVLSLAPSALTPPAYAEMPHNEVPVMQDCLIGCMNGNSPVSHVLTVNKYAEEDRKDRAPEASPYHAQFFKFYTPQKITPRYVHIAHVLRPPDLVILNASYLS